MMAFSQSLPRLAVLLSQLRTAFDIGKQKGHRAGWDARHGRSPVYG
jgi:hypothetical protein